MSEDKIKNHKEYMKLAVKVIERSIPECKNDYPGLYVGEVLVFSDGSVDTTYHGEIRYGDHAEYTVLDKKNRHRDHALDGAKIQLEIKPDQIIIKSPDAPTFPITIESLKNFTATSWSRNKKLAFIFNEMDYMEEFGISMDTFRSLHEKYQLPLPIINYDGSNVIVTLPRTTDIIKVVINSVAIAKLKEAELVGHDFVRFKNKVSKKEYTLHLGLSDKVAQSQLKKMRDLNLIGDNGESSKSK